VLQTDGFGCAIVREGDLARSAWNASEKGARPGGTMGLCIRALVYKDRPGIYSVPGWSRQRLLHDHPVPSGQIASFYAIPGTSCQATLMSPSGTTSRRAITIKLALMERRPYRRHVPTRTAPLPRAILEDGTVITVPLHRFASGFADCSLQGRLGLLLRRFRTGHVENSLLHERPMQIINAITQ
jgi:hypothetical protein